MKELWKRLALAAVITLCLVGMVSHSLSKRNITTQTLQKEQMKADGLTLWYTDESLTEYLTSAAVEFGKEYSTTVNIQLVNSSEYLNQIAQASVTQGAVAPDIFIAKNSLLEEVYEAGLAVENTSDKYTEKEFAKSAISSVTYHDKKIAYPLSFHTVCMVYRSDLIERPASLEYLINYDVSQVSGAAIDRKIDMNMGNVLSDSVFVGNSADFGGENGDEPQKVAVNRDILIQGVSFYYNMLTSIGIAPYAMEESMILGYADNKSLSIILSTDYLGMFFSKANESGLGYDIIEVPKINENIPARTSSYTDTVVVNGMSDKTLLAQQFAEFLTYDYVDELYAKSGLYPARHGDYGIEKFEDIYGIYQNSESFPKLLETEDLNLRLGELFEDVASGSDINQAVFRFADTIEKRFETQKQEK